MSLHQPDANSGDHKSSVMDGVQISSSLACLGEDSHLNYDLGGKINRLSTATPLQLIRQFTILHLDSPMYVNVEAASCDL